MRYVAFVVGKTGDPVLIDLGPTPPIDEAIEQLRQSMSDPRDDHARDRGHALYALTMAKIAPALGGATSVLIAPDGALNVVPFAALVDDHGDYLIKRFTFTYLTSGRDLLRLTHQVRPRNPGAIFADPAFDAGAGPTAAPTTLSRGRRSNDLARQIWKPLPGTAQEADEIIHRLPSLAMYRGARATETALKALHGPKILHLATHGFFLDDQQPLAAAPASPSSIQSTPSYGEAYENPLLRAGLVLAGANQLASGDDDGILTAMEASGLDLDGTQIVVLSACETGVGKVTNGDGVYGLRRALVIAGAESMVMSLWQVDDTATRDLMAGYYARLTAGKPRSAALRDIQLEIQGKPKYAHPYYWASFLPAGDSSPIQ
jgi:CHAT domain-containing protein